MKELRLMSLTSFLLYPSPPSRSLSPSPLLRPLDNGPLDDGMLINNRQVKWRQIEISRPVTTEPNRGFPALCIFLGCIRSRCISAPATVYFVARCLPYHKACYFVATRRKKNCSNTAQFGFLSAFFPCPSCARKTSPQHFPREDQFVSALKLGRGGETLQRRGPSDTACCLSFSLT